MLHISAAMSSDIIASPELREGLRGLFSGVKKFGSLLLLFLFAAIIDC